MRDDDSLRTGHRPRSRTRTGRRRRAALRLGEPAGRPDLPRDTRERRALLHQMGPRDAEASFRQEAERMRWAASWIRVPRVLDQGEDETHEWLVTTAIEGESAVAARWTAEPATAVKAVGEGLRALHDALPVQECPWEWTVPARIAHARRRGIVVPEALNDAPSIDRLVVCHGDACCPNTLLDDTGRWAGHVDLAALGVGDRWADIAVAAMSTEWNYGPGWEDALVEAYGIEPDRERIAFYRELWNAT
ncbi:aminoglycoside 3'-phosphotransferase [Microbacterium sp. NIBRBAC000506063]|uniref:aminoglycoside 3'-phosphotransferase n=1 Tax=Microbacterium sp. NIBRBAC000506063 TaxID=2734618 RepID=UPI002948B817|nr:aminoglycoside 3'-phosphotransferase [Microbacterium sp. NIBRBAC000506063]